MEIMDFGIAVDLRPWFGNQSRFLPSWSYDDNVKLYALLRVLPVLGPSPSYFLFIFLGSSIASPTKDFLFTIFSTHIWSSGCFWCFFFYDGGSSTMVWKLVLIFAGTPLTWMGMDRLQKRNLWRKVFNQFIIPLFQTKIIYRVSQENWVLPNKA